MKFKRPQPIFGKQKEIKVTSLDGHLPITDGWNEFKKAIPISASPETFAVVKQAYFAGALGLYASIMRGLDEGAPDGTPEDLSKMERIHSELFWFKDNMKEFLLRAIAEGETRKVAQ